MCARPLELLRELLRIPSVNPPGGEEAVAHLLGDYLSAAGLETAILRSPGGRTNLVARLEGPSDRPALVLLSHGDVVPVERERWNVDPFAGEVADGFVWGRGALDMKGIAVMHAVAAARLAASGRPPRREVIVVVAADEEAGGDEGTRWLLEEHRAMIGFGHGRPPPEVMGEGAYGMEGVLAQPVVPITVGEKKAVWFDVVTEGDPSHGALPPERQAAVDLATIVKEIAGFGVPRVHPVLREQFATLASAAPAGAAVVLRMLASPAGSPLARPLAGRLRKAGPLGLLLSDSVTPTVLAAGYKSNVVPGRARASFDSRLLPDTPVDTFLSSVGRVARRHRGRIVNVTQKGHGPISARTGLFDLLSTASAGLAPGAVSTVALSPGISDLRLFRARGATGYGWCPLLLGPDLLASIHGDDERVPIAGFEHAVEVMAEVVDRAATSPG